MKHTFTSGLPIVYRAGMIFTIAIGFLISSCGAPTATNVELNPSPNSSAPLAGILTFTSDKPAVPTLTISDGDRTQVVTPDETPRKDHEVLVLGLRPGTTHTVSVTLRGKQGKTTELDPLQITTPPLPNDFPDLELIVSDTSKMEPGVTVFDVFRWTDKFKDDPEWCLAVGVDEEGEVVWYWKTNFWIGELRRMPNGNLKAESKNDGRLLEVDMLGRTIREWHTKGYVLGDLNIASKPVDVDGFHHDIVRKNDGNFIGLGVEVKSYPDYPLAYPPKDSTGDANIAADVIIEFDEEGKTVHRWSVTDIIDPYRLGEGSLNTGFYANWYENTYDSLSLPFDVTHCNALYYIEEEDALIVSTNHLCALFKIDMSSGELIWILGDSTGWKEPWSDKLLMAKGDVTWPCHQHGVEMTPRGTLLLFDNGGKRYIPPAEPMPEEERFSQVVEYRVDEVAGTVEQVWSYGPREERFLSSFISDADHLPETGNVLVTDGARFTGEEGQITGPGGDQWARIFEVTYPDKEKVWELHVTSDEPYHGFSIYRANRLKSLYPLLDTPTN